MVMALWELLWPKRPLRHAKWRRWGSNLTLAILNALLLSLLSVTLVQISLFCLQNGWGLFNYVHWSIPLEILLGWLALDFGIYLQHVMSHHLPVFWRLHQVHHADPDFDVTTGVRFHPLEILVSFGYKVFLVVALGPSVGSVVIFEIVLNLGSTFNHGNVRMPTWLDTLLRWVVVTPDMHRVHHSIHPKEANTNFGFSVPWWDYLCGTYLARTEAPQSEMDFGVSYLEPSKESIHLNQLLFKIPFKTQKEKP